MADKSPLKVTYNGSDTSGLAEFESGDTVAIADGGTGATTASGARTALGVSPTAGSSSLTTLGTISTGVWEGTDVAIAHGGTGASTASQARTNLGITDTTPGGSNKQVQFNNSSAFGGSANLAWDNSNNRLGIGTDSPTATLEVAAGAIQKVGEFWGTETTSFLVVSSDAETQNNQSGITFNATTGNIIGSAHSVAGMAGKVTNSGGTLTGDMIFNVNAGDDYGEKMRLLSSGRLGIGTSSPSALLTLNGTYSSGANGPNIEFFGTATDAYPSMQILNYSHDDQSINFDNYYDGVWKSSDAGSNFQIRKGGDKLTLRYDSGISAGSTLTWNTGFVMDTSGNIGIATDSPESTLTIDGDLAVFRASTSSDRRFFVDESSGQASFNTDSGSIAPDGHVHIHSGSAGDVSASVHYDDLVVEGSGNTGISILAPEDSASGIAFGSDDDNDVGYLYAQQSGTAGSRFMAFGVNAAERLRIDSAGGVKLNNAGQNWYYAGSQTVGTSYEDVDTSLFPTFLQRDRAYLLYWVSYANHYGDTSSRQYGIAWVSGNAHSGSTNWRATVTVLGSNTSGYHGYANLTFANGGDGVLDVKRSSSSQQSYVNWWVQSACGTGTV